MTRASKKLAVWGEDQAASFLQDKGYRLVARNARTPYGEIDLVAQLCVCGQADPQYRLASPPLTVFVEVKTRRSLKFGYPEMSVTARKRAHLLDAAQAYLQLHPELAGDWRVDVIAILLKGQDEAPEILHFENAFTSA
jgi:putative endonuclease